MRQTTTVTQPALISRIANLSVCFALCAIACALSLLPVKADPVLLFNGTDSYVDIGPNNFPDLTDLTLEAWVKRDKDLGTYNGIAGQGYYSSGVTGFGLTLGGSTENLGFQLRNDSNTFTPVATFPYSGEWHHVAGVREGDTVSLYLNGVLVNQVIEAATITLNTTHNFGIGATMTSRWTHFFTGAIAEVRLWNHARAQEDIATTMNWRLTGIEEGLLGYWPLNDGEGSSTAVDLSPAQNHGTIHNAIWDNNSSFALVDTIDLQHPITGSTRFSNTNIAVIVDYEFPVGYSHYQISLSDNQQHLNPSSWALANDLIEVTFPQPAVDTNLTAYLWFTNLNETVTLRNSKGSIYYTTVKPEVAGNDLTYHLVEGYTTATVTLEDISSNSSLGNVNEKSLNLFSAQLTIGTYGTDGTTPIIISSPGVYTTLLTLVNEAGNSSSATGTLTVVEGSIRTWTGHGSDTLASNPDNWLPAAPPTDGCSTLFDTAVADATWDLDIIVSSWTQTTNYTGTITFNTCFPDQGSFTNFTIARNASLHGGIWTHPANTGGDVAINRLAVTIDGNFTLNSNAAVNVDARGYAAAKGPGAGNAGKSSLGRSASYGGAGAYNVAGNGPYGSATRPTHLGSGAEAAGGGAIALHIGGQATLNGLLSAQGGSAKDLHYHPGTGGSILVEAGTITGCGLIQAGMDTNAAAYCGSGGGRIALHSHTPGDNFATLTTSAHTHPQTYKGGGRAGTVYLASPDYKRLIIDQKNFGTSSDNYTDLPAATENFDTDPAIDSELAHATLIITNGAFVSLTRDLRLADFSTLNGTLMLNSWTIFVNAPQPSLSFPENFGNGTLNLSGLFHRFPDGYELIRDGRLLWDNPNTTWRVVAVASPPKGGVAYFDNLITETWLPHGANPVFQASPADGYDFIHWDGTIDTGLTTHSNPLTLAPIENNQALRAWFLDTTIDTSTNFWSETPVNTDWYDQRNWSQLTIPQASQTVVLGPTANALLTNTPPELAELVLDGGTLSTEGWDVKIIATRINLISGTLTHQPNTATEPDESGNWIADNRLCLECSNMEIGPAASINADGKGFAGGPPYPDHAVGYGPGGGGVGSGTGGGGGYGGDGYGAGSVATPGKAYLTAQAPILPGSGGGSSSDSRGYGGSPGGGLIEIYCTGLLSVDGAISANGANAPNRGGAGSGGAIIINCGTLTGTNGTVKAQGGTSNFNGWGGGGRIALYAHNSVAQAMLPPHRVLFSTKAGGGDRLETLGTLHLSDDSLLDSAWLPHYAVVSLGDAPFWHTDELKVSGWLQLKPYGDNQPFFTLTANTLQLDGSDVRFDLHQTLLTVAADLTITNSARLFLYAADTTPDNETYGALVDVTGTMTIAGDSWLYPATDNITGTPLLFRATNIQILNGGGIDATGRGWAGVTGPGKGVGGNWGSGGGHGGAGGDGSNGAGGETYGTAIRPLQPGSGGGRSGSYGGGVVWMEIANDLYLDGSILANGAAASGRQGAGAGGAILINCHSFNLRSSALLSAVGGDSAANETGGGGGGRIAIWYGDKYSPDLPDYRLEISETNPDNVAATLTVDGGIGGYDNGEPGTIRFVRVKYPAGTLLILK